MDPKYKGLWQILYMRKMTKKELMEKANISQYQINKMNHNKVVTIEVIEKIVKALNVSVYSVTSDEGILSQYLKIMKKPNIFPVIIQGDDNLKYIFPTKQRDALKAISIAKLDGRIKRLIIFGSSVTMRCGTNSDMDIAIDAPDIGSDEFEKIARAFFTGIDSEIDIVHYNSIHSALLKQEIDSKGVDIYVKC